MTVRFGLGSRVGLAVRCGCPLTIPEPDTILGAAIMQWVRSDSGLTYDGGNRISAWNDKSAAAVHYTQGTAGDKPLYVATGGPNSLPYVSLDSSTRHLDSTLVTPNPSTTPTTVWLIFRQVTWAALQRIVSDASVNKRLLYQRPATPTCRLYDGTEAGDNSGATVGSWVRGIAVFNSGATSRLKLGTSDVTGFNDGATAAGTGRTIGNTRADGQASAVCDFCEVIYIQGTISAGQETALDTYAAARYGGSLVI